MWLLTPSLPYHITAHAKIYRKFFVCGNIHSAQSRAPLNLRAIKIRFQHTYITYIYSKYSVYGINELKEEDENPLILGLYCTPGCCG
jgi:hypothetical protein